MWISAHPDLDDDEVVRGGQMRFLPTRIAANGRAIDIKGEVCHQLACPRCHLTISRTSLELNPLFFSILGAPGSGKSHFLASAIWQLRKSLGAGFSITFGDADPVSNRMLNEYEEKLFLNNNREKLEALPKTEKEGDLYESVELAGRPVLYPRPFVFYVRPQTDHPRNGSKRPLARSLCLYDNAGEHFLPGEQSANHPGTQHLAVSRVLLFLFDPTQHHEIREQCKGRTNDPQMGAHGWNHRQDQILLEAESRIRAHIDIPQSEKDKRPLIVVVTKHDAWCSLAGGQPLRPDWIIKRTSSGKTGLHIGHLMAMSDQLRQLLLKYTPEIVTAAEGFSDDVTYIPVSALGRAPELIKTRETTRLAIRPRDIKPAWAEVPLLYALYRSVPGLIASVGGKSNKKAGLRTYRDTGS